MARRFADTTQLLLSLGDGGHWQQAVEMLGRSETALKAHYNVVKAKRDWDEMERRRIAEPKPEVVPNTVPANWSFASPVIEACKIAGIHPSHLREKNRKNVIAHARQHVMYLLHLRGWSYPKIGQTLGGMDHTTIMHGVKAHAARVQQAGVR